MKKIKIYQLTNETDQPWAINFNGKVNVFTSYGAALAEAKFLMWYYAFTRLRGETEEGAIIIRVEEIINPETQLREKVEVIVDETHCNDIVLGKLERWS
jgi:hypothetical protein